MHADLAFAQDAARRAGEVTLRYFQQPLSVDAKADMSPVTRADREAESLLREMIRAAYPDDGILGEEEGVFSGSSGRRWVIDPIDGTKSFICGVPLYAVLLSLEVDGEVQVGVAHFPALDEMFWAVSGGGAFLNGSPIQVSGVTDLAVSTLSTGSHGSLAKYGRLDGVLRLAEQVRATRGWSDAYGHCLVACGRTEGMIDPVVAYYDISAVSLIVREAGGRFTDLDGTDCLGSSALSSNGVLHETLLGAFA